MGKSVQELIPVDGKISKEEHEASRETLGKCSVQIDGEWVAIGAKHKIPPVAGSATSEYGGKFRGGDVENVAQTGTCRECGARVKLSAKGFVGAHTVRNAPAPVAKTLAERTMDVTDTGVRTGDPEAGSKRRATEISGALGTGTVQVPRPGEKGRTKLVDVEATEENMREALAYWHARKPRTESARKAQSLNVSELTRRLDAARKARVLVLDERTDTYAEVSLPTVHGAVLGAQHDPEGLIAHSPAPGPALVKGRPMEARQRDVNTPWDRVTDVRADGTPRKMTTNDGPLGRERFDRMVTDVPEPAPKRSKAARRRYRRSLEVAALVKRQQGQQ